MATTYAYPRRSNARAWLGLAAAAAAVLLMLVLIAVACRAGDGGTLTAAPEPTSDQAVDDDASGGAGQAGESEEPGSDDSEGGPGGGDAGGPGDGGPGGGDPGGGDPGGGDPGGDGPHDTWQPLTGVQVVEERHPAPSKDYVRTGVRCPAGKVVLNGGFRSVGPATWGDPFLLQESSPGTVGGGATSLWLVSVYNDSAIARFVDLFAVCADPPPGYEVLRIEAELSTVGPVEQTPHCSPAAAVLGGGAQVIGAGSANFSTRVLTTRPAGTGWRTHVDNHGPFTRNGGFRVVCSVLPAGYEVVFQDLPLQPESTGSATATCPAGTAIGGGVEATDGKAGHYLRQSYPDGGAWSGTVDNVTPLFGQRLFRVWAVCAQTA